MMQVLVPLAVAAFIIMIVTSMVANVAVNTLQSLPSTATTIDQIVTSSGFSNPNSVTASSFTSGNPDTNANDDNNVSYWQAVLSNSTSVYTDSTSSTGVSVNNDKPLVGIYVNSSSALIGQNINDISLNLRAVGTPTQPAQVGVYHTATTTTETTDPNGTTTTAVSTSDGVPALVVNSGDSTVNINNGDAVGELTNEKQSLLYGYPVTAIDSVRLAKTGTPQGNVYITILNSTGLPVTTYATVDVSQLSTSTFVSYGGTGSETFVGLGQAVGIYYDGTGSQTAGSNATVTQSASQLTGTSLVSLSSAGSTIIGERADTGSALIGDTVNALEVRILRQTTATTGTVTFGVFNAAGTLVYSFCTFDASHLTTSQTELVCVNEVASYTIATNDRLGVKFASGDGSNQVQLATSGSNPFDGTTSYRETFSGGTWTASTGSDLRFRATLTVIDKTANHSIDLDGSSGHVSTGDVALIANNTSTVSIFAAISPDTAKDQAILSDRHITNAEGAGLALNTNNNLVFNFYPTDGSGLQTFTDSRNVTLGTFQTVGVIFNGTHATFCIERSCTVDDNVISSKAIKIGSSNYWRIGHREQAGGSTERFDGKIDDVLVYNVAKTQAQAISIQKGIDDYVGLVHKWDFNAGTDTYHPDTIGTSDGITSGTVTYADGYGVGSYVRIRVSNEATSGAFDRTANDTRTSYAEYNRNTAAWVIDATHDMKQTITGTTRSASSVIDDDLNSFWINNEPVNPGTGGGNTTSGIIDYSQLVGANFDDPVLKAKDNAGIVAVPSDNFYHEHFAAMRAHHFTVMRVPYNWEAYAVNTANFLDATEKIARIAGEEHMKVFFDNHQFYISSKFNQMVDASGSGFPAFAVGAYDNITCYEAVDDVDVNGNDPAVSGLPDICTFDGGEAFWDDFYVNCVDYNGDGDCTTPVENIWQDMANMEKAIIGRVDSYDSVIGYEIMNEPHIWQTSHYAQLGDFYDFMYHELREVTNKDIHLTGETPHGTSNDLDSGTPVGRSPSELWKIFPDNDGNPGPIFGIVWQPHHYNHNTLPSQISSRVVNLLKDVLNTSKGNYDADMIAGVIFGEFGMGGSSNTCSGNSNPPTAACQEGMDEYLGGSSTGTGVGLSDPVTVVQNGKTISLNGLGWTYWKWDNISGGSASTGRVLMQKDAQNEPTTPYMALLAMDVSLGKFYNTAQLDAFATNSGSSGSSSGGVTTDSIYLNFTNPFSINHVTLKHRNADFVPDDVCIFISNSTSDWGTADECASLTATSNNQTITVSPAQVGRFIKVVPGTFQQGRFWHLSMVDAGQVPPNPIVTTVTTFEIIPIKIFGTIQPSALTSSFTTITRSLVGESYLITDQDFIGIYYTENNPSNYIEVMTDTTPSNPDTTNTMLMYVQNNATQFASTQDLTGSLTLSEHIDLPSIYADMGSSATHLDGIRIYKSNASNLPASVDIYVGNTTVDVGGDTNSGAFVLVVNDAPITQETGTQTIDIPDNTYGRYTLIQVNDASNSTRIDLAEFDVQVLTSETVQVEVPGPPSWADSVQYLATIFVTAMIIMILAIIVIAFKSVTDR